VSKIVEGRERIRQYLTSITSTPLVMTSIQELSIHHTTDPEVIIAEHEARGPHSQRLCDALRSAPQGEERGNRYRARYWSPLSGLQSLRAAAAEISKNVLSSWRKHKNRETS
jgi:hypothetical protein